MTSIRKPLPRHTAVRMHIRMATKRQSRNYSLGETIVDYQVHTRFHQGAEGTTELKQTQ